MSPEIVTLELPDPEATTALGRQLAGLLFPGSVVALEGPLGAGKTYLVRALAEGLGIGDSRVVSSPTFVLIQEYDAQLPIYHFDAYRLPDAGAFFDLGVHEYFAGQGVCLVEWADRVSACMPQDYLRVQVEVTGPLSRRVRLEGYGARYATLVGQVRTVWPDGPSRNQGL